MIQIRAGMPSASYQQHLKDQNATLLFDLVRRRQAGGLRQFCA